MIKNIRPWQWFLILALVLLSASTWYFLYTEHLTLVYNDAKSYLNISRLVVDSQQPGLAQIGSVWLPLTHILKLPLIWSEWMWHSGLAGSLVSMISYILTVIGVGAITWRLTRNQLATFVAGVVIALNVNFLYLQSTPLTEPLYLMLLVWSAFFLLAYVQTSTVKFLLPAAVLTALQCLTRYDGWFVAGLFAAIIFAHELWVRRQTVKKAMGHVVLFATPVVFVCLLWFGWNALIFGDPLYFIAGPGSAHAQQTVIDESSGLITKGSLVTSSKAFGYAVVGNIGWWILGAGVLGWLVFAGATKKSWRVPAVVFGALGAVFIFNVLALFLGFSSINVPELGWGTSNTVEPLFNVRYGLLLLPFAALGAGLLVAAWRPAALVLIGLVAFQGVTMLQETPITLRDGQRGASAFVQHELAGQLNQKVGEHQTVLLSMTTFNPLAFESGLALNQFTHEGVQDRWNSTLANPTSVDWVVMGINDADPIYRTLHDQTVMTENFQPIYQDKHGTIYQRIDLSPAIQR